MGKEGRPDPVPTLVATIAAGLDRAGIISADRFRPTMGLAWPRIVTGFAIMSKQTVDLAMVGVAVGTAGTAGLAYAIAYWEAVAMIGLGLAGGTISLVAQHYGAEDPNRASIVVNQSVLVAVGLGLPIAVGFVLLADPLIGVFGGDPASRRHGAVYLVIVAPAVVFEFLNLVASRTYTGTGDAYTEMMARAGGALLNVLLSGLFIFGFGLGVAGAALGTSLGTGATTLVLGWGMLGRSYGRLGMAPSPVPIRPRGPWFEPVLIRHLVEISLPEMGRRLAGGIVVFPLLWVAATFGPLTVTAIEIGRRIRSLITSLNWGLSIASSSLVGRSLGAGDADEAAAYGADILRLTATLFVAAAIAVILFAAPIAGFFLTDPTEVERAAPFVAVGAVSAIGYGIDGAATGALVGAGATRWPFVASLVGRYGFAVPAAVLGLLTPLGVGGLYLALVFETAVPAAITFWLFRRGGWREVSGRYRVRPGPG